jgi:YesN/AraC family two-component response regulator
LKLQINVVIVEDDVLVGDMIAQAVQQSGMVVVGRANDGSSALELVRSLGPDVVLMDIEMPEMNGVQAAILIQQEKPTPLVFLTSYEKRSYLESAIDAGAGAYLLKPPKPADIERAVLVARARHQDLMEQRRLNAELKTALAKVQTLSGLLPICGWCKKIRNDEGYWQQIEAYISQHTDAVFSHGVCPDCRQRSGV